AAAELALESQAEDHEIDAAELGVDDVAVAQQLLDALEQLLAGAVGAEQPGLDQVLPPGLAAAPVEVEEHLVGEGGHGVLGAAIELDGEVAAAAPGVQGLPL